MKDRSITGKRIGSICLPALFLLMQPAYVPAQAVQEGVGKIIHVNIKDAHASDQNPGTERSPLRTIGKAAAAAQENQKKGIGTKILIHPGNYRESVGLESDGPVPDVPIVFEASETGGTVISGSDIWENWRRQPGSNVYQHPWPYTWAMAPYPVGWRGKVVLEPVVRRREMVFVNGKPLDQVLSEAELKAGSFYVSEEKKTVSMRYPNGVNIDDAVVEVATRSNLFHARGVKNIVLKGLTFQHDTNPIQGYAVTFVGSSKITVDDCRFVRNNWGGLVFHATQDVLVRNSQANYNGGIGMGAWKVKKSLWDKNETSYNNWRGVKGGFTGWAVAGLKHLAMRNAVYLRHRAIGNQTRGFWLDSDNADILIEDAQLCGNLTDGIFIEASQGPITVKDSLICHNRTGDGILTTNSADVTLENSILYGNGRSQIRVTGNAERSVPNRETGERMALKAERWTLTNNVIVASRPDQLLLDISGWRHFMDSLRSDKNLWYKPGKDPAFRIGSKALGFTRWQSTTGRDLASTFDDPRFKDPDNPRLGVLRESPLPLSRNP